MDTLMFPTSFSFSFIFPNRHGELVVNLAIGISRKLYAPIVEVILVDKRILQTLCFMSVAAVYAPIEMCEIEEMGMLYAKLDSPGPVSVS